MIISFSDRGIRCLALLCVAGIACGFLRNHYSDPEVVSRAELILVARMQEGSLRFVRLGPNSTDGWEHQLEISISEVLKGAAPSNSIVVSIPGGLTPLVGGYHSNQFGVVIDYRAGDYSSNDVVEIFDTGSSGKPAKCLTGDIRTNHIWLLRYEPPLSTNSSASNSSAPPQVIGIQDPEDIQPLSRREELLRYLK